MVRQKNHFLRGDGLVFVRRRWCRWEEYFWYGPKTSLQIEKSFFSLSFRLAPTIGQSSSLMLMILFLPFRVLSLSLSLSLALRFSIGSRMIRLQFIIMDDELNKFLWIGLFEAFQLLLIFEVHRWFVVCVCFCSIEQQMLGTDYQALPSSPGSMISPPLTCRVCHWASCC
jgi:hypothetical protein